MPNHTADVPYEASVAAAVFCMLGMVQAMSMISTFVSPHDAPAADDVPVGLALSGLHGTPFDPLLGDAALAANGRHLLVEFKRRDDLLHSELGKPRRLAFLNALTEDEVQWSDPSTVLFRAHAVLYAVDGPAGGAVVAAPYVDLAKLLQRDGVLPKTPQPLDAFCRIFLQVDDGLDPIGRVVLSTTEPKWGVSLLEFTEYLTRFVLPTGEASSNTGRERDWADISGYWLCATRKSVV